MTVAELKKLWEPDAKDKITKWNEIRPEWPDEGDQAVRRGHDSGTFEYFTEAIVGKKSASRTDYTASEDDNVIVLGIEGDKFALGYLPYAYYEPNKDKLKAVEIDWKADDEVGAIEPSARRFEPGNYNPLSRPLFIYVNKKLGRAAGSQGVRRVLSGKWRQAGRSREVHSAAGRGVRRWPWSGLASCRRARASAASPSSACRSKKS